MFVICGCLLRLALLCPLENHDSRGPRTFILITVSTHSVVGSSPWYVHQSFIFVTVRLRDDTAPVARLEASPRFNPKREKVDLAKVEHVIAISSV
jgi:hypothetical protein